MHAIISELHVQWTMKAATEDAPQTSKVSVVILNTSNRPYSYQHLCGRKLKKVHAACYVSQCVL